MRWQYVQGINNATDESHTEQLDSHCDTEPITGEEAVLKEAVSDSGSRNKENVINNQLQPQLEVTGTSTSMAGAETDISTAISGVLVSLLLELCYCLSCASSFNK